MTMLRVYKSTIASCRFISKKGKECPFINFRHLTADKEVIEELDAEVALGHPLIFIDKTEREVDSEKLDPLADIKRKAVEDYKASVESASSKTNDRGISKSTAALNVANSTTVAALTSSSGA